MRPKVQSEITWSTNEHGSMTGVQAHDGHLSELEIAGSRPCRILVDRVSGGRVELRLHNVTRFGLVDFCNGSIISDVLGWPLTKSPDVSEYPDNPWRVLFANNVRDAHLAQEVGKLRALRSNDTLLQIVFSYGGSMAFLCERVSVFAL